MSGIIRKKNSQKKIPILGNEQADFAGLMRELEKYSETPQSQRVLEVLELVSALGPEMPNGSRLRVITRFRIVLSRYHWQRWVVPGMKGFRVVTRIDMPDQSTADKWEYQTVDFLLSTVSEDKPSRIRRCAQVDCRMWFFAGKRLDQQFCSDRCKQRAFDTDPIKRENKKRYMKDRYAAGKKTAANPKSGVGLRERPAKKTKTYAR